MYSIFLHALPPLLSRPPPRRLNLRRLEYRILSVPLLINKLNSFLHLIDSCTINCSNRIILVEIIRVEFIVSWLLFSIKKRKKNQEMLHLESSKLQMRTVGKNVWLHCSFSLFCIPEIRSPLVITDTFHCCPILPSSIQLYRSQRFSRLISRVVCCFKVTKNVPGLSRPERSNTKWKNIRDAAGWFQ